MAPPFLASLVFIIIMNIERRYFRKGKFQVEVVESQGFWPKSVYMCQRRGYKNPAAGARNNLRGCSWQLI
jgi:hypothetical protein